MPEAGRLAPRPTGIREAQDFMRGLHRHHAPPRSGLFALGVERAGELVGVAIVGRPVSRHLDDGRTVEVTRVCVREGVPGACSFLYARARTIAGRMGYLRALTYTLPSESGASLRGAGWICAGPTRGGRWNRAGRPRADRHPTEEKLRWEVALRA